MWIVNHRTLWVLQNVGGKRVGAERNLLSGFLNVMFDSECLVVLVIIRAISDRVIVELYFAIDGLPSSSVALGDYSFSVF